LRSSSLSEPLADFSMLRNTAASVSLRLAS